MKVVMAKAAVDRLRGVEATSTAAKEVAEKTIAELGRRTGATAGMILLDREGNPGFAFNTPRMAYGYVAADGGFVTGV
jgi:beta-aspartyl-peptidase (threonine type)